MVETVLYLSINGGKVASLDRYHTKAVACALFAQLDRWRGDRQLGEHVAAHWMSAGIARASQTASYRPGPTYSTGSKSAATTT
jgi:hypothetical protein